MSDLQRSITALFRRKGKESLTEQEFVSSASFDLRWFSPKEAQKLLDVSLTGGYLQRKNGHIMPTFDLRSVEVPLDFKPSKEVLEQASKSKADLFSEIVEKIVKVRSVPKREVVSKVNKKQEMLGIDVEPAALLVASDYGLSLDSAFIQRAESEILSRDHLMP
ncbi:MAG: hypothetical protein A3K60_06930 [Euryarchaeota archaeon RBG_19FT_COMBO_56_21]|nr:MAG: hypothetical protein A3K60_06930 [Euryarchaeota archaeon RBG_19FT_COMBO_56_21]